MNEISLTLYLVIDLYCGVFKFKHVEVDVISCKHKFFLCLQDKNLEQCFDVMEGGK